MADKTDKSTDPSQPDNHGQNQSGSAHDGAGHGDDQGHGQANDHGDDHGHEVPADMIPEGSWQDMLLMFIAGGALLALLWSGVSVVSGIKVPGANESAQQAEGKAPPESQPAH